MKMVKVYEDPELSGAGIRAFTQIAKAWDLTDEEMNAILGQPVDGAFAQPAADSTEGLPRETIERISYVLGIYRALHIIFPNRRQADGWVRRPNTGSAFNGNTALSLMCTGLLSDLAAVHQHLESQCLAEP
ncbi:antitoxin Xre/MbcA/ParS toxin-binding domain-containing protein [Stenotrophomonas maltophilia]|jgi:hypothetical protein|uniref:antitoxin Xre/MbcA/ParS toxin-binding domain-containing protein n=1 Tax=Stenotrophomonas maltophilia TaxID=40324 RepID=UPI0015DF4ECD|nr:antitoxin Xre/MbcA/ParS toxin-binding domain-containing protein [Stenotrophomonas maltophilia]MBA0239826.1 DUF2384 domain-containing protein [Stenotrophomonas maltophilia]